MLAKQNEVFQKKTKKVYLTLLSRHGLFHPILILLKKMVKLLQHATGKHFSLVASPSDETYCSFLLPPIVAKDFYLKHSRVPGSMHEKIVQLRVKTRSSSYDL